MCLLYAYCGPLSAPTAFALAAFTRCQEPLPERNAPHLPDSTSGGKQDSRPHLASYCLLGFVVSVSRAGWRM